MTKFSTHETTRYRLCCEAMWDDDGSGCAGTGPAGYSEADAKGLAVEDGWRKIEDRWACPSHVKAKEKGMT